MSHLKIVDAADAAVSKTPLFHVEMGFIGGSTLAIIADDKQYNSLHEGISNGNVMDVKTAKGMLTVTGDTIAYLYRIPFEQEEADVSQS